MENEYRCYSESKSKCDDPTDDCRSDQTYFRRMGGEYVPKLSG
jgi:hypothetical protein